MTKKNPTFSVDDLLTSLNIINRLCINNIFHGYICQYLIQKKYIFTSDTLEEPVSW